MGRGTAATMRSRSLGESEIWPTLAKQTPFGACETCAWRITSEAGLVMAWAACDTGSIVA
jgi:hypothetical protein